MKGLTLNVGLRYANVMEPQRVEVLNTGTSVRSRHLALENGQLGNGRADFLYSKPRRVRRVATKEAKEAVKASV